MPRQDVPYGGALCRLKERIAEIWDELGKKLHSINGVEGDGAGDVKIVSGDAAVVITSDQVNHQIEVALDSSQLPAASVASVNGHTGAVALDAGDIPSDGNSDVQTDIDVNKAAISACSSAITSEQLARQNADSTLQGNINTLSASIPTAAATAVANDPTVAQLATDVPNKVDKITSGSSLKAYTHTGATQGETSVVDGTAANSIGIRDAIGRMRAADPASGATDKTLVTANWVSQTGAGRPNNIIHESGVEHFKNYKIFEYPSDAMQIKRSVAATGASVNPSVYFLLFKIKSDNISVVDFKLETDRYNYTSAHFKAEITLRLSNTGSRAFINNIVGNSANVANNWNIVVCVKDGYTYVFTNSPNIQYSYTLLIMDSYGNYNNIDSQPYTTNIEEYGDASTTYTYPTTADGYTSIVDAIRSTVIL